MNKKINALNDAESAEHYWENREELEREFNEAPSQVSRKPERLTVQMSIRFTVEESAAIDAAAQKSGLSTSAFIRQAAYSASDGHSVDVERLRKDARRLEQIVTDVKQALSA